MSADFRKKLRNRESLFGAWTSLGHPSITETFTRAGVDFISIDLEHSTISLEEAQGIMATSQAAQIPCLPRISSHNAEQIKRLLDSGADGLIVPMVNSKEEALKIIEWSKYPPLGKRSFGVGRAQGYGHDFDSYTKTWNERSVLIVQIESVQGVEAVESILALEEIDGVMAGPYDLSGSLGIPGQLFHPEVVAACDRVAKACAKYGKACGTQIVDPNEKNVQEALKAGQTFVVLSSDVFLLWKWGERMQGLIGSVKKVKV
ncbi:MAG: 5-keto-4-deoxy-D-glucarate aldolase [Elusimicrobia bacterium]|nr:5-keto-4-deoxy-D-glucarate aldolase [Elusimicrobiota bacterium]